MIKRARSNKEQRIVNIYEHQYVIDDYNNRLKDKFKKLRFIDDTHSYSVKEGDKEFTLESVTTWISRFSNKFDDAISEIKAKVINEKSPLGKRKDSIYYKRRWDHMRISSEHTGSRIHEFAEYGYPHFEDHPYCDKEKAIISFYENLHPKYVLIDSEVRMYSIDYKLAGTIDCLALNLETGKLVIFDWKTNNVPFNRRFKNKILKEPFDYLWDTAFNKYCLQLSLYKTILEKELGCEVEDLWIIHLTDGNTVKHPSLSYEYDKLEAIHQTDKYVQYRASDVSDNLKKILNKWQDQTDLSMQ